MAGGDLHGDVVALYQRLHEGMLLPGDVVDASTVSFDADLPRAIEHFARDRQSHAETFADFLPPFELFRGFQPEDVVLDVGAHWGYSAVTMRHLGCPSRIVSIEAMPQNIPPLDHLTTVDPRYRYVHIAASDEDATLRVYTPVLNGRAILGLSSVAGTTLRESLAYWVVELVERYPAPSGCHDTVALLSTEVSARRLDDVLAELAIGDRVTAVKMDIEGHEPAALRGMTRQLARTRPMIMIEAANRVPEVSTLLTSHGYFHAARQGSILRSHPGRSRQNDGFWLHPEHERRYEAMGIFIP